MGNLRDVVYLSNEDYETLASTGTVTIDGETLTYDENNIYITPDATESPTAMELTSQQSTEFVMGSLSLSLTNVVFPLTLVYDKDFDQVNDSIMIFNKVSDSFTESGGYPYSYSYSNISVSNGVIKCDFALNPQS